MYTHFVALRHVFLELMMGKLIEQVLVVEDLGVGLLSVDHAEHLSIGDLN